jgi:hypothetical protein
MNTIPTAVLQYHDILVQEEKSKEFVKNLFDEEGPFGESDCAGL